jgi:hypothetical protein
MKNFYIFVLGSIVLALTVAGIYMFQQINILTERIVELETPQPTPTKVPEISNKTVKLYYHNNELDPEGLQCQVNDYTEVEVALVDYNLQSILDLIREDFVETVKPFDNFELNVLEIENGVAKIEVIDPDNYSNGGSCWVGILSSQIKQTALQLPEVTEVEFIGDESIFQP